MEIALTQGNVAHIDDEEAEATAYEGAILPWASEFARFNFLPAA
jgi:hypothetical protein